MKKKTILELIALVLVLIIAIILALNVSKQKARNYHYECKTETIAEEMYSTYNSFIIEYEDDLITKIEAYKVYQINDKNVYSSFIKNKTRKYIDTYKKNKQIKDPIALPDNIIGNSIEIFTKNNIYTCKLKED